MDIGEKLQEAWLLRWNQKIDEAMMTFAKIQVDAGWDLLSIDKLEFMSMGIERENYLEALLLKSSFLRAQGQEQKSSALLRRIFNKNAELLGVPSFRLIFELGLDSWRREDIAEAMDYFLLAEKKARNSTEQMFSLSNLLWCLEALDFNREAIEKKLDDLITNDKNDKNFIRHVYEQWVAYKMRSSFYRTMQIENEAALTGQVLFFKQWVMELPYIDFSQKVDHAIPESYLWQNSYRMRTLTGLWSPVDRSVSRVGDAIDRLYLWVWKWIAGDKISIEKIAWTLDSILVQLDLDSQSKENLLLLRNSCAWITFLAPQFGDRLRKVLRRLEKNASVYYPLLETEFYLIQSLSKEEGKDLAYPLAHFSVFEKIYRGEIKFVRIEKRREVLNLMKASHGHLIYVDLANHKIMFLDSHKTLTSPYLTKLLMLMNENKRVSFKVFGADLENRHIYNLATRLRKIFPKNSFSVEKLTFVRGPHWPKILIDNNEEGVDLHEHEEMDNFLGKTNKLVGRDSYYQAARALTLKEFTRLDLEKHLCISKASACRMLDEWGREFKIIKSGNGKNVTYFWKE